MKQAEEYRKRERERESTYGAHRKREKLEGKVKREKGKAREPPPKYCQQITPDKKDKKIKIGRQLHC